MDRHLNEEFHKLAVLIDGHTSNEGMPEPSSSKKNPQPDIRKSIDSSAKGICLKMTKAASEITPSLSHKQFSILVKYQRINGVCLAAGKDSNKAATIFPNIFLHLVNGSKNSILN